MVANKTSINNKLPENLRPLLWHLRWEDLNIDDDKEDIILSVINEGNLDQWRWLINIYGKELIRDILGRRLASEFHPESRNLAKVIFSISHFNHARRSTH